MFDFFCLLFGEVSDRVNFVLDNKGSALTVNGNSATLSTKEQLYEIGLQSVLFTCENSSNCSPCKVVVQSSSELSDESKPSNPKTTIRCNTCEGCTLKAEIIE